MYTQRYGLIALLAFSAFFVPGLSRPGAKKDKVPKKDSSYPFNQLVVFGDQLSDNGNGSFAHGLDPGNIYGFHTWTDGPVAVQYLADLLNSDLLDYAWGGWFGGGLAGSTIDNNYTPAKDFYNGAPVPSTQDQIFNNYTGHATPANIGNALQLIWAGQNDVKKHTNWWAADPHDIDPDDKTNVQFYGNLTSILLGQAEHLIKLGAPGVVVVNIYTIEDSPESTYFFCKGDNVCSHRWGTVIEAANSRLQAGLAASAYADKIIYYDVHGFMKSVMANKAKYGYTEPLDYYCDGNHSLPTCQWDKCTVNKWSSARPFFWFTNDQMETSLHQYIAKDMQKSIDKHFGL